MKSSEQLQKEIEGHVIADIDIDLGKLLAEIVFLVCFIKSVVNEVYGELCGLSSGRYNSS